MTRHELDEAIGERVHQLMWRKRVSQESLGEMLGCTQSAVSKKLRGKRGFLISELVTVADYFDVPIPTLLPSASDDVVTVTRQSHLLHMAPVVSIRAGLDRRHSRTGFIPSQQSA